MLGLVGCGASDGSSSAQKPPAEATATRAVTVGTGTAEPGTLAVVPGVVRKVEPSVVTIITDLGLGSGVIYSSDGKIVTDAHVVGAAEQVQVEFADGKHATAQVMATDPYTDLALIKVDRTGLPAATFATVQPSPGSLAIVIGSPLGLTDTVTTGIVSATGRDLPPSRETPEGLVGLIQTDAPISPGNSGGGLFNSAGQVIGLAEAYIPPSVGAVAIGFANPATEVSDIVEQLAASGHAKHAYLGVTSADLTPEIAAALGLQQTAGVIVYQVQHGSPAAAAGLRPGDVITRLGATPITDEEDLQRAVRSHSPGENVQLTVVRDGKQQTLDVTIGAAPTT
jgi:S1-C subfamily serine protease